MAEPQYIVNVEGAIVREGRYLLAIRGEGEEHAPGTLSFPGGKVEVIGQVTHVLEETLRREIAEEVGVGVGVVMAYVSSTAFVTDNGDPVVDVVFLCRYAEGEAAVLDAQEVAEVAWLTAAEIATHPQSPPWTQRAIALAEATRLRLGW